MQKSHSYILIALLVGFFLVFQWQMNKMDRKLTCIYSQLNAIPSFVVPELRSDFSALQAQVELVESACDKSYIFTGIKN